MNYFMSMLVIKLCILDLHVSGDTLTIRNVSKTCVAALYRCEVFVSGSSVCNQTFNTIVLSTTVSTRIFLVMNDN